MKAPVLGLLIAGTALGASTIYLSMQLQEERALAAKVATETSALKAQIAQLEKVRMEPRFAGASSGAVWSVAKAPEMPMVSQQGQTSKVEPPAEVALSSAVGALPMRGEAFQKMMRSQLRASNRRIYADVATELNLTREQANKLIDLLTDQQTRGFSAANEGATDRPPRSDKAEIIDLLGSAKAEALVEYQKTIPARQELEVLARQIEGGADSPLTDYQQKRMLEVMMEEQGRVPTPAYSAMTSPEEYRKVLEDWQNDYAERLASQARSILTSEQLTALDEYQQWQKEIRQQMPNMLSARGVPGGGRVHIATTAGGQVLSADIVGEQPEAAEAPRKSK